MYFILYTKNYVYMRARADLAPCGSKNTFFYKSFTSIKCITKIIIQIGRNIMTLTVKVNIILRDENCILRAGTWQVSKFVSTVPMRIARK